MWILQDCKKSSITGYPLYLTVGYLRLLFHLRPIFQKKLFYINIINVKKASATSILHELFMWFCKITVSKRKTGFLFILYFEIKLLQ